PHGAGMLIVQALDDAYWSGGDEITGNNTNLRMRHGGIGQPWTKGGFNIQADLPGRFLGALQGCCAGWLGAATKLRVIALEPELLVDLRSRAMHQNQLHTQS